MLSLWNDYSFNTLAVIQFLVWCLTFLLNVKFEMIHKGSAAIIQGFLRQRKQTLNDGLTKSCFKVLKV